MRYSLATSGGGSVEAEDCAEAVHAVETNSRPQSGDATVRVQRTMIGPSSVRQNLNANPTTGPCVSTSYLKSVVFSPDS
jgi:hypothetical protein